jgi:preprotein translocase subunit SecF
VELIPPGTNINFVGNRKWAYLFSALLLVLSLLSIPIMGGVKLGIDFTGGMMVQVRFNKPVETEQIRSALVPLGENLIVQKFAMGGEDFVIRMEIPKDGAEGVSQRVKQLLEEKLGRGSVEIRGAEVVGPKVGKDLQESAIWATVIALALLLVYVAFRFDLSMALGAILCLMHDVMMVYGFFAWTGKEFNLTILAAVLTVIGYDVNDTIVVCDRIRENLKSMRRTPLADILNMSINQTLSRTILTAGGTLLVIFSMLILETGVLGDFAWALLIGIILGTYSSIFVATPLILAWDRFIPLKRL